MNDVFYVIDLDQINLRLKEIESNFLNKVVLDARNEFYGLGWELLKPAVSNQINYLLVNNLNEALKFRKYNNQINLIIQNIDLEHIYDAIINDFIVTIYDYEFLNEIVGLKLKDELKVYLYLNCGENIWGIDQIQSKPKYAKIEIVGYYTMVGNQRYYQDINRNFQDKIAGFKTKGPNFIGGDFILQGESFLGPKIYTENTVSLQGIIRQIKKYPSNSILLNRKVKTPKYIGIIHTPFKFNISRVMFNKQTYPVLVATPEFLLLKLKPQVKVNTPVKLTRIKIDNLLVKFPLPRFYIEHGSCRAEKDYFVC